MASRMKNLHIPVGAELYEALMPEARRVERPATQVARQAIERWLEERRKEALERDLARYVRECAGTSADLDPGMEAAGIELWLGRTAGKRRRRT